MARLKTIIADDEKLVRERIRDLIATCEDFVICAQCANGRETIEKIETERPDVLFLDIKMPKASGFEVLEAVALENTRVIFVTAFDQYAVKAFEYAAFDYLVKPITRDRFYKTIARIRKAFASGSSASDQYLILRHQGLIKRIRVAEVTHLEAFDNYVKVHTAEVVYKKRDTLTRMTKQLQRAGFLRVHRSYTINPAQVRNMVRIYQGDYLIRLSGGRVVTSSRSYRENVKRLQGRG